MKIVSAILGCILFVLFFGFALKNTDQVDLHFFLGYELRGPPTVFRHRRESSQHKNTIQALQSAAGTAVSAPQPDSIAPR
jgi:putative membrane protein